MRLVVDFDDTLSFATERDWENAKPNLPLIAKLNSLYDQGHQVDIFTARGTISCKGDRELAEQKNRPQIEAWLNKHGVKYHSLSFQKPLADYYIDDKAITPDDFVNLDLGV